MSAPIGEGPSPGAPESRPLRRGVLLWIVPAIAVLAGLLVWALGGRDVETDNAYLKADLVTLYPEIDAYAGTPTLFTPHLGAYERGILSTIHVDLAPGWDRARIEALYQEAYGDEPFVRRCPAGVWPSVADVRHTNFCDFGWAIDPRQPHMIIASAVDNLVKGAAGQAVQAMNARFGLDERLGLLSCEAAS